MLQLRDAYDPGPQPGGREPAPGRLGLVQAFVNSSYDLERNHGVDLLGSPAGLGEWLAARGLLPEHVTPGDSDLLRALDVRDGLRALLVANNGGELDRDAVERLNAVGRECALVAALDAPGADLRPAAGGIRGALATVIGAAAAGMLDGSFARLKACRQHDCRWAFYDHSRNRTGSWCSMRVCGGRAKARAYYRRRRGSS